jgi:hypothetical protein
MSVPARSTKFEFCIPDAADTSNLKFLSTQRYVHAVWYQKNENPGIYLSSNLAPGSDFSNPERIIETNGEVKDIQIIAKDNDFVITIIENVSGSTYVRAATGIVKDNLSHQFKPCEKVEVEGDIINAYTIFTETASEDHIFVRVEIVRRDGLICFKIDEVVFIHCTRLSAR